MASLAPPLPPARLASASRKGTHERGGAGGGNNLHMACLKGDEKELQQIIDNHLADPETMIADPDTEWYELTVMDERGRTPLHCAADEGFAGCCEMLIKVKSDVTRGRRGDEVSPLMIAAGGGHLDVVNVCLEGIEVRRQKKPLLLTCFYDLMINLDVLMPLQGKVNWNMREVLSRVANALER